MTRPGGTVVKGWTKTKQREVLEVSTGDSKTYSCPWKMDKLTTQKTLVTRITS
jgi:hypothetical protein